MGHTLLTPAERGRLIAAGAVVHRLIGSKLSDNPHKRGTGAWYLWRYGWKTKCRRDGTVTRETLPQVGRGKGALGERSEWTAGQIEALEMAEGWMMDREIAAMLGNRTPRAVRNQRNRRKARDA